MGKFHNGGECRLVFQICGNVIGGNVISGKCHWWEMSLGEMSLGEMSMGEISFGEMSVGEMLSNYVMHALGKFFYSKNTLLAMIRSR